MYMFKKILLICAIASLIGYGEVNNTALEPIPLPKKLAEVKRAAHLDETSTEFSLPSSFQYRNSENLILLQLRATRLLTTELLFLHEA